MNYDILGVGALAVDDLVGVAAFPVAGEKTRVLWRQRLGGGLAGTALVAASRLGARCAWLGVLGNDDLSRAAHSELEAEGIETGHVVFEAAARPHASVILVEQTSGRRSILAGNDGVQSYPVARITPELVAGSRVVFVDHTQVEAGCRLAELARERGIPVVGDIERWTVGIDALLPLIDHLLVGIDAGRMLSGADDAAAIVRSLLPGRACVAVTDGERGCWFACAEATDAVEGDATAAGTIAAGVAEKGAFKPEVCHIAASAVDAVDTTGCGDVFHGAYMAAIARGEACENALREASAAAALAATRLGGRAGAPTWAELAAFLQECSP
jgi:sulfofructose kinase